MGNRWGTEVVIQCLCGSGVHDRKEDFAVVFVGFYHRQDTGVCLVDEGFLYSPPCPYRFLGWSVGIGRLLLGLIYPGGVVWGGVGLVRVWATTVRIGPLDPTNYW